MATASEATDKDFEQMMQMLTGFFVTQIAGAVATYSIADHLAKGPATAEQMATLEEIDPGATFRLLRACASLGLVTCNDGRTFSPTPLLSTLRSNVPGSLHGIAIAWSAPGHWLPWGRFPDAVRTSECQTVPALGASIWDYYARQPEESAAFTAAMHGFTSGVVQDVTRLVDTSTAKLAVDIGGSSGTLVHSLMTANPKLHGIILDLADVAPRAAAAAVALGLAERSRALAGDFFASVPEADLYLLKHILHDWNDGQAVRNPAKLPAGDAAGRSSGRDRVGPKRDWRARACSIDGPQHDGDANRPRALALRIPCTAEAGGLPARQEQPGSLVNGSD
jgi:O-methyltransferase domain/Dimerisation domain